MRTFTSFSKKLWRAMTLVLLTTLLPSAAWAQFGGGRGTQGNPYIIKTTDHMTELANAVNEGNRYNNTCFRLDADLDYTGKTYTIIGDNNINKNAVFLGEFNGNGHTISGVQLDRTSTVNNSLHIGLFGSISVYAVIENLTLSNSTIRGRACVGGIVGRIKNFQHIDPTVQTIVRNCHVTSDVTIASVNMSGQNTFEIGGIVGVEEGAKSSIIDCTCAATLSASSNAKDIGGIIGYAQDMTTINNCAFTGSISGSNKVGGILGVSFNNQTELTNCYIGGSCTIGAVGVEGSGMGTNEGYDVKQLYTIKFNSAQLTNGTIDTPPVKTISGIDYFTAGSTITLSNVSTFGKPAGDGMMWTYQALTGSTSFAPYADVLPQGDGTWQFTMPAGNVLINPKGVKDISPTDNPYATRTELTPATAPYTSKGQKPTVGVVYRGINLTEGTDFITDVPAEGFTAEGKYAIKIWGIGAYGGMRTDTFTIGKPWEGEGTQESPFLIKTTDDMERLATIVKSGEEYEGVYFRQTADLDFTGKTYTPVGVLDYNEGRVYYFNGNYDGRWYSITGINVSGVHWAGVFGGTGKDAKISNIILVGNCFFSSYNSSGGIVGHNEGEISDCRVVSSDVVIKGEMFVGGIAGQSHKSINYCESMATIELSESNYAEPCLGGFVGKTYAAVSGDFSGTIKGRGIIGGLVGHAIGNTAEISGRNFGEIITTNNNSTVGGIVGNADINSKVISSMSTCLMQNVSGTNVGAIIGVMNTSADAKAMNNYYIGACKYGGITGTDVFGKAMRGWPISHDESISFFPIPDANGDMVGTYYDDGTHNNYYVGAGEALRFVLFGGTDYTANGTALTPSGYDGDYDANYYEITMSAPGIHIAPTGLTLTLFGEWINNHNEDNISDALGEERSVIFNGFSLYKDGSWNTICLPFALTTLTGTPLEGAELMEIDLAGTNGVNTTEGILYLTFKAATSIEAGKPYVIRWASDWDIVNPTFADVTIAASQPVEVVAQSAGLSPVTFKGTYKHTWVSEGDNTQLFLTEENKLVYPTEGRYLLPFRCWFSVNEITASGVRGFSLDFAGDKYVTSISGINRSEGNPAASVYDLQGRRVAQPKKGGVYIVGGKKMIVK